MKQQVFNQLLFDVAKEVFYEVLENPDKGFGFQARLKFKLLTELQIDTLNFLLNCYNKKLLGHCIELKFTTEAVGEIKILSRTVEKIEKNLEEFIISNSY